MTIVILNDYTTVVLQTVTTYSLSRGSTVQSIGWPTPTLFSLDAHGLRKEQNFKNKD